MPEGDTIVRTARTLARALEGREVLGFRSPLPALADASLAGRAVARVEPRGKHLLIHFDDGRVLHSHMRMTGSWHVYRPAEPWWKPERLARAVIETADFVAVCFNAPVVELLSAGEVARHPALRRLGPDVLGEGFDPEGARTRLRSMPDAPIGEALLAQGAIAGIGNIYKSEALFATRINPFSPVGQLSDAAIDRLLGAARRLMSASVEGSGARRTRSFPGGGPRYAVYRRSGLPCLTCATKIRIRRQGDAGRSTYWCPRCQGAD
ncbi:MAG: Fpg/Nei family DNA glycosylase [Acidobacteriota bacterium]|nr:Fpg/Nei family DNA glycosylase [Acidobacteriota bacterium]